MINTRIIEALDNAYITMKQYNYDAYNQFLGYLMTGDISYITSKNSARMKMLEFDRDEVLELMLEVFFGRQPMSEYSGKSYNAAKNLVYVLQAMTSAGYDPVKQIVGFMVTDDVSYVSVKNGARNKIRKLDGDDILQSVLKNYLA